MLFALSTRQTRRSSVFILNVLAICLGIVLGGMSSHLALQSVLSPFTGINIIEDIIYTILDVWLSWFTEAVLLLRIAVVFPRSQLPAILAFPIAIKSGRAAINILFSIQWTKSILHSGAANQFIIIKNLRPPWLFKASFILELIDNSYISSLFLWRLAVRGHLFNGTDIGRVSYNSKGSYTSRLQSLFWIASTNFVFPLIFGLCQIITIFLGKLLLSVNLETANVYVEIISTVFATIWSSTASLEAATTQGGITTSYSASNEHPQIIRMDRITVTTSDPPSQSQTNIENGKPEDW